MRKIVLYFLLIVVSYSYSQERIKSNGLYTENGLTYKKENNIPFTGICEFKKEKKNHPVFEKFYTNGWKSKYIEYYNSDEILVSEETIYHDNSTVKKKVSKFSMDGKRKAYAYFDMNGNKELEETFIDGKLTYRCEYLNGKKNGKEFCITKKGDDHTELYEKGKKVK